jgi:hypothetical protein
MLTVLFLISEAIKRENIYKARFTPGGFVA